MFFFFCIFIAAVRDASWVFDVPTNAFKNGSMAKLKYLIPKRKEWDFVLCKIWKRELSI